MDLTEYEKVKDYSYRAYCDYLQNKYGIGLDDFMTPSWSLKKTYSRTSDGLYAHHKDEDKYVNLMDWPKGAPYECQKKENIVYCDLLEHLLLHVLICYYPHPEKVDKHVGEPGIISFLIPELNDVFSGWKSKQKWKQHTHNIIVNDKDVYLKILKQYISYVVNIKSPTFPNPINFINISKESLHSSLNGQLAPNLWNASMNQELYNEIDKIWDEVIFHNY